MAAGDAEANDATTLRHAPLCKVLLERLPETGAPLASHPTLSRCATRVSRTELSRMARVLVEQCLASYRRPPTGSVLDVDATEDPVHGGQEQARYESYYGGSGFLPRHVYEGLSGRLSTSILKAKRCTGVQRLAVVKRLVKRLRTAWPKTLCIFRGESHFASPEVRQWIDEHSDLRYVTGWTSNTVLQALAHQVVEPAKRASARAGGTITRFPSTRSQAGTWARARRVVSKVAVCDQGVNPRCVVTDLEHTRATGLSQPISGARGEAETDSTDHTRSLKSARTSCQRFEANPFRVLWHAAADVLLDTLRREG